jgi:hypothetical protein
MPADTNTQNYNVPIPSPIGSTVLTNGTTQVQAIGQNLGRRGVTFSNPSDQIIYVTPSNQAAVVGQGVPILPGAIVPFIGDGRLVAYTCGWNAIAASGSNKPLMVLEFV